METATTYNEITLLITHYNRPASLKRLIVSFEDLAINFAEIIVSDDGSASHNLDLARKICLLHHIRLITSPKNKGLGNNINKGQDEVKTPLTLYIQEDFVPTPLFKEKLPIALELMKTDTSVDIVRFYAYFKYPCLRPVRDGFSHILFHPWAFWSTYNRFYVYSDHPHLRRSSFLKKFGRYIEGIKGDRTEYKMMMSFLKKKGKALYYDNYQDLFTQLNSTTEPSTMSRDKFRNSSNIVISAVRHVYRHVRFNFDFLF